MGYIKIDRSLASHWLWTDKPYSKGQAWIDLLMMAQYKDNEAIVKGRKISRKRGEVHISLLALADRWGWSRNKVRRFITLLETEKMVQLNATTHDTTITIENYNIYQDSRTTSESPIWTPDKTPDETPDEPQLKKEIKENKERVCTHARGKFINVILSDEEYRELKNVYVNADDLIEKVSLYKAKSGRQYASDYAALLSFAVKDGIVETKTVDDYERYLAEAKVGCPPPQEANLTDKQRAELEIIAYEVWRKK